MTKRQQQQQQQQQQQRMPRQAQGVAPSFCPTAALPLLSQHQWRHLKMFRSHFSRSFFLQSCSLPDSQKVTHSDNLLLSTAVQPIVSTFLFQPSTEEVEARAAESEKKISTICLLTTSSRRRLGRQPLTRRFLRGWSATTR